MRRHAKASTAGSTQRQANGLGRSFRGAFATRAASPGTNGSGAPATGKSLFGLSCLVVLALGALLGGAAITTAGAAPGCPNADKPGAAFLPDCRAWEMASPPDKNGGDVIASTVRTRAAADGSAVGFASLNAFGDPIGTGIGTDYLSERSSDANPGSNGWRTHAVTPLQGPMQSQMLLGAGDPLYVGDFSADLSKAVFHSWAQVTNDPNVAHVPNLYLRNDLRNPGPGSYDLLTACSLCAEPGGEPLPHMDGSQLILTAAQRRSLFAAASPDFEHVLFETRFVLTADTPPQPAGCDPSTFITGFYCRVHLYEWDHGTTRLAGVLPDGSAADVSIAGQGTEGLFRLPHVVSDGSDGHTRIFFTQPTNGKGATSDEVPGFPEFGQIAINRSLVGNLYMRLDHTSTEQLNTSERDAEPEDAYSPASFRDASADGTRAFFMTNQALTDDAPADGEPKIYMYDASKPASAPDNLTLVTVDGESDDNGEGYGVIGTSDDGHYVYFVANGQLVSGGPLGGYRIYLWHDGDISEVGPVAGDSVEEQLGSGVSWGVLGPEKQSRVTPDGQHLLFSSTDGTGLTGYDHGSCSPSIGNGSCRELYLYSAASGDVVCASCNPSGAPATAMATVRAHQGASGTRLTSHVSNAFADDGSKVFFSTDEALVSEDTNGVSDAYEYNAETEQVHLLSSGTDKAPSWFMDASADGHDAFFATSQQLVGWDVDGAYDLYDARVDGGFPEPPAVTAPCSGDSCRQAAGAPPLPDSAGSAQLVGPGNAKPRHGCPRGRHQVKAGGKTRCVKNGKTKNPKRSRTANNNRRASR